MELETKKAEMYRRKNKLSENAQRLLDGLKADRRQTILEWSQELYHDKKHRRHVANLLRRLRDHGYPIVLIPTNPSAFPPEPRIVRLMDTVKEKPGVVFVNGNMQEDVKTRLETYGLVVVAIVRQFPTMVDDVQVSIEKVLRTILETKLNLLDNPAYAKSLPSGDGANKQITT